MIQVLFMLVVFMVMPIGMFFYYRSKTAGRILVWIVEDDRTIRQRLLKVEGNFVNFSREKYVVNPKTVRLMRYPIGWPVWIQQILPCALYQRGEAEPLDWTTMIPINTSAVELATILEPHWLSLIVQGTKEGGAGSPNNQKIMLMAAAGIGVITLVAVLYLIAQIGGLEDIATTVGG